MITEVKTHIQYKFKSFPEASSGIKMVLIDLEDNYADKITEFAQRVNYATTKGNFFVLTPIWKEAAEKAGIKLQISGFGPLKWLLNVLIWGHIRIYKSMGAFKYMKEYDVYRPDKRND